MKDAPRESFCLIQKKKRERYAGSVLQIWGKVAIHLLVKANRWMCHPSWLLLDDMKDLSSKNIFDHGQRPAENTIKLASEYC